LCMANNVSYTKKDLNPEFFSNFSVLS
jgi:hypothetical protein